MKALNFETLDGGRWLLHSIGWKVPKASESRIQFYALNEAARPLVLTARPAVPQPGRSSQRALSILPFEPFPEAVCTEISCCRLLAPPCFRSLEEFNSKVLSGGLSVPWQRAYWETHREILLLHPTHDTSLKRDLDHWLAMASGELELQRTELAELINRTQKAPLKDLGFNTKEQRTVALARLHSQLEILDSDSRVESVPSKGRLKLTLEEVKDGCEGIRDTLLQQEWANQRGEDLGAIWERRQLFASWLETCSGAHATGLDFDWAPTFLEACARVQFSARFSDKAETVVFLEDVEIREELTVAELDDVARLRGSSGHPDTVHIMREGPDALDLSDIYDFVNIDGTEWRKAGPQMVKRSQLAKSQGTDTGASSFRDLLEVNKRRWFYRVSEIRKVREAGANYKLSKVPAHFDMTDWNNDWRPKNQSPWSHPGKKSILQRTESMQNRGKQG